MPEQGQSGDSAQTGQIWVFGYGSLVHRPGFEYSQKVAGYIKGWRRVWHQGSTDHRGTPEAPGRTVTLEYAPEACTYGMAYALAGTPAEQAATLRYLEHREKQYDVRERVHVWGRPPATSQQSELGAGVVASSANGHSAAASQPHLQAASPAQQSQQQRAAAAVASAAAHAAVNATLPSLMDDSNSGGGPAMQQDGLSSHAASTDAAQTMQHGGQSSNTHSHGALHRAGLAADVAAAASSAADAAAAGAEGGCAGVSVPAALHDNGPQPDDVILVPDALVYIGSIDPITNANYLGPASHDAIARQIATAVGPSGHNTEYLFKLADAMREMGVVDQALFDLEARVRELVRGQED